MAFMHGSDTEVTLDGNDLSDFTKQTEFTDTTTVHKTTTYGRKRETKHSGLGDGTITISGLADNGAAGPRAIIKPIKVAGDPVPFVLRPEGAGSGKAQSTVDVIVSSYKESLPVDDMVSWEAELEMTGDLDETNQ